MRCIVDKFGAVHLQWPRGWGRSGTPQAGHRLVQLIPGQSSQRLICWKGSNSSSANKGDSDKVNEADHD
jgi:hypothetical protein